MSDSSKALIPLFIALPLGMAHAADAPEFDFSFEEPAAQTESSTEGAIPDMAEFDFSFDEPAESKTGGLPIRGKLAIDLGYQFDSPKRWQTIGPATQLIVDWNGEAGQLYSEMTARYNHAYQLESDSQNTIDEYRITSSVRELYWKRAFGDYTLTLGRAIVAWGKADLLPVIDVISPSDSSSLLFAKPEELRLGQDLIKLDWYRGSSEFNFIYTPRARYNLITDHGHPYSMTLPTVSDSIEDNASEWAMRWTTVDDRLEYAVIAGDLSQRAPLIVGSELSYVKSNMLGANIIYSNSPFLWKSEFLLIKNSPYQRPDYSGYELIDTLKGTLGFDYANSQYGNWTVEYGGALTASKPPTPLLGGSFGVFGINWSKQFMRDDLTINTTLMLVGGTDNRLLRIGGSYKLDDDWSLVSQLSLINADSSEPFYQAMSGFDRFDLSLEYGFDLSN